MDEPTKAQIFEPFYSTKGPGEGTGLGLSMVHGIVNQSGGTISVDTAPGQGARFNILLPCAQASQKAPATRPAAARARRGTETILLVEDEHPVRELAKRFLTAAGYHVLAASNGGEALLTCESVAGPIDLLVTDVVMPMMSGRELWERLCKVRPGLRVVYMSGYSGTAIAHHGLLGEGIRLVEKPFSGAELTREVGQALEEAQPAE
jgi:CheY-like chemotaxis protein